MRRLLVLLAVFPLDVPRECRIGEILLRTQARRRTPVRGPRRAPAVSSRSPRSLGRGAPAGFATEQIGIPEGAGCVKVLVLVEWSCGGCAGRVGTLGWSPVGCWLSHHVWAKRCCSSVPRHSFADGWQRGAFRPRLGGFKQLVDRADWGHVDFERASSRVRAVHAVLARQRISPSRRP